jgi:hypothetical protein
MSNDAIFKENLAIGTAGEDIVYDYLVANNSFVHDHRKENHDDRKGPRLKGTEGELVLPDFSVRNKSERKGSFSVDSKVKTSVYTVKGKKCFTVDNKFEQYKLATQILKLDYLMMVFLHDGRMYFYKEDEYFDTTTFANQYSTGLVYLFEYDEKKIRY